jgi:hypothetical protein
MVVTSGPWCLVPSSAIHQFLVSFDRLIYYSTAARGMQAAIRGFGVRIFGSPRAVDVWSIQFPFLISIHIWRSRIFHNLDRIFKFSNFEFRQFRNRSTYIYRNPPLQLHFQIQSYVHFPTLPLTHPKSFQLTSSQPNPMSMLQEPRSNPPPHAAAATSQFLCHIATCRSAFAFGTLPLALCHFALVLCHRLTTLVVTLALS